MCDLALLRNLALPLFPYSLIPLLPYFPHSFLCHLFRPAPILSLLTDTTAALAVRNHATLAARVHSTSRAINIAILGSRLFVRVSFLICPKREHQTFYQRDGDHACTSIIFEYL